MAEWAFLALGSNLGDRAATLDGAVAAIRALPESRVQAVSTYHDTAPVGGPPGQPTYLNAALSLETSLDPLDLLHRLLTIERQFGRVRGPERQAPRTLDLDLLLYADRVMATPTLDLPHPRMHLRSFVLEPLAEVAGEVVHPLLGLTIRTLRDRLRPDKPPGQPLTGRRVVVTGSSSGIGRAMAVQMARAGAWVVTHGRHAVSADATAQLCRAAGGYAEAMPADLSRPEECDRLVDAVWSSVAFQGADVWVNNAGADTLTGEAARWSFERKLAQLWAVDVQGTLRLSRSVGARLREQGGGVILNMGWDQAEVGMAGDSGELFAATKGAIMAFSRSLALSLAPTVRVNTLAPGWIRTAWGETASDLWQQRAVRETPAGRWGTPEDVAAVAVWLASPAAAFLTGQTIRINGGAVR